VHARGDGREDEMTAFAVSSANQREAQLNDLSSCPNCFALLAGPQSSNYLGLGRIEHFWQCETCGEAFRTTARMAGLIEVEPQAPIDAAR
jgi:hypothetical protein